MGVPGSDKPLEPVAPVHSPPPSCLPGLPCDDLHPCTVGDGCGSGGVCQGDPDDNFCALNAPFCVIASSGQCQPGNPEHDANGCFYAGLDDGLCDPGPDGCVLPVCKPGDPNSDPSTGCIVDHGACPEEDGIECTVPTCDGLDGCFEQPDNAACDDGDPCTIDVCSPTAGGCNHFLAPAGTSCDDGASCSSISECNAAGQCIPLEMDDGLCVDAFGCTDDKCDPLDPSAAPGTGCVNAPNNSICTDTVGCTVDVCNPGSSSADGEGCVRTPNDGLCDNGQFCDGAETCDPVDGCQAGTPPPVDDGIACTADSCNETTNTIVHVPQNSVCDNGSFCDGVEQCDLFAGCVPGNPPPVNDGIACTADSCNETTDTIVHTPINALCDNGQFCDGAEICAATVGCVSGTPPNVDDGVGCTNDSCNEVTDTIVHTPVNALCDNGQFCDGAETCDAVDGCQVGTPPVVDDGVGCTADSCNETTNTVVHVPQDSACDNGQFCDGAETCDAVDDCQPGTPPAIDDGVACTADSCNEVTDTVVHAPQNSACDDGAFCNGAETCDAVDGCQAGTAPTIDDGVGCTADSCNEVTDSIDHAPQDSACDNGQFCDGAETCDAVDDCQPGTPPSVDDGISCTDDSCNETTDTIDHISVNANCADGVACTVDTCDPLAIDADPNTGCVLILSNAFCNDGQFCNGVETCDAVDDCQPGIAPNPDDGVACTDDSCNEVTDSIENVPNNGNCDDGQFCNGAETCDAVDDCQAGTPPTIDDGVACTDDSCNEVTDAVVNAPNDGNCDNGQFCDGAETCDATLDCLAGTPPAIDDGVACTDDSCDEVADVVVNAVNDGNCDDGQFCNGAETCDATADCQAGTPPTVGDGVGCTVDSCDEAADVVVNTPSDALCDNGQFCDGAETCDPTADCQAGTAPATDDGVGCTDDSCDEVADVIVNTPNDASCDDGQFCNGTETCDATADCQAGTAVDVSDGVACTDDSCDEVGDTVVNTPNDANCDDLDLCTADFCDALGGCGSDPIAGCCNVDADCNDGDACTTNVCSGPGGTCSFVDIPGCCNASAECEDGNVCTVNTCSGPGGVCSDSDITGCCNGDADCNDGIVCTNDACDLGTNTCTFDPIPACCAVAADCNDGNACTTDTCDATTGECSNVAIADCCNTDADCNDGDLCTADTCSGPGGFCLNAEIPQCCEADGECNDGDVCTADACNLTTNRCEATDIAGCCELDSECDDGDVCTADTCDLGSNTCVATDIAGCCNLSDECDDGDECTVDTCLDTSCVNDPIPGCGVPDAGVPDAGMDIPDAGIPDAGEPDAFNGGGTNEDPIDASTGGNDNDDDDDDGGCLNVSGQTPTGSLLVLAFALIALIRRRRRN